MAMELAERPFPVSSTAREYSEQKAKVKRQVVNLCHQRKWELVSRRRTGPCRRWLDTTRCEAQSLSMNPLLILSLAFAIGVICGLRSLAGPAVVAWAAHLGWLPLHGTALGFMASWAAVIIFTLAAVGELAGDKLPQSPSRTAPLGLGARFVTGGLCGAAIAVAGGQALAVGAILGAVGGIIGAFAGYQVRTRLVKALHVPDFVIAIAEDLFAIGCGLFLVSRF